MENKDLFTDETDKSLLAAFAWWEKKRIIYNIVVGATGLFFIFFLPFFTGEDVFGIVVYGVFANLFYSLGFLIEIVAKHYFKSNRDFTETRKTLFVLGLIISVLITAGLGTIFGLLSLPHQA